MWQLQYASLTLADSFLGQTGLSEVFQILINIDAYELIEVREGMRYICPGDLPTSASPKAIVYKSEGVGDPSVILHCTLIKCDHHLVGFSLASILLEL